MGRHCHTAEQSTAVRKSGLLLHGTVRRVLASIVCSRSGVSAHVLQHSAVMNFKTRQNPSPMKVVSLVVAPSGCVTEKHKREPTAMLKCPGPWSREWVHGCARV